MFQVCWRSSTACCWSMRQSARSLGTPKWMLDSSWQHLTTTATWIVSMPRSSFHEDLHHGVHYGTWLYGQKPQLNGLLNQCGLPSPSHSSVPSLKLWCSVSKVTGCLLSSLQWTCQGTSPPSQCRAQKRSWWLITTPGLPINEPFEAACPHWTWFHPNAYESWLASQQQCCWGTCRISKQFQQFKLPILQLPRFHEIPR